MNDPNSYVKSQAARCLFTLDVEHYSYEIIEALKKEAQTNLSAFDKLQKMQNEAEVVNHIAMSKEVGKLDVKDAPSVLIDPASKPSYEEFEKADKTKVVEKDDNEIFTSDDTKSPYGNVGGAIK